MQRCNGMVRDGRSADSVSAISQVLARPILRKGWSAEMDHTASTRESLGASK